MHFSSFKSWISLQAEVSQMIEKRETFSSPSFLETSASRKILDGRVLWWWKTEKGNRNNLHMNFCPWEYETMKPYEGLGENKLQIDLLNFSDQLANWWNNAISSQKFFVWKGGHYLFLLFGFLQCSVNISNGNRIDWSPVRSNHTSD